MEVGDRDLLNPNTMRDDMHDWVVANEHMAKVLAAKHYPVSVCVCAECGARGAERAAADDAGGTGVGVAGIQGEVEVELLAASGIAAEAGGAVVVDHAGGLHEGVDDDGADKFEAALS